MTTDSKTGIIIVDHGSRRSESNAMLEEVARQFVDRFRSAYDIVEPAHMELAMPDIAAAYARCVERGAEKVVILPFFLAQGKHWTRDIPSLTSQAAAAFPGTRYQIAEPLGIDAMILELMRKRLETDDQPTIDAGSEDPRLAEIPPSRRRIQCATCPFELHDNGTVTIKPDSGIAVGVQS